MHVRVRIYYAIQGWTIQIDMVGASLGSFMVCCFMVASQRFICALSLLLLFNDVRRCYIMGRLDFGFPCISAMFVGTFSRGPKNIKTYPQEFKHDNTTFDTGVEKWFGHVLAF